MTTNHIERLDPALIRPGRVDVIHHVGDASPSQIRRLFLKFFPDQTDQAGRFVTAMEGCTLRCVPAISRLHRMLTRHADPESCGLALSLPPSLTRSQPARLPPLRVAERTPAAGPQC
eukprot:scaffold2885_cov93-Isochrysis_galbana.AAC.7